ncbi:carbohydrate ABC transporter permease [Brachyspira pilosicoli]|uniref:Carbohydrate ABC transporter permease n=1 Tax=Brachyspira pilosicoli TaxID=52584 RepID=A0A5C8EZE6_BRAPL|nr:carbohydrate ABC transporter permease [Brachyspira pilosicoli]TXJ41580.1 carbohydrate ABC transporter permease [Brachyspira pilosicoli]
MTKKYKQIDLLPGYALLSLWCAFTFLVIGWIILASFSTTPNIFQNTLFKDGLHPENYVKALVTHNVAKYFLNSIIYTIISCFGIVLVGAPAAYILARFLFKFNNAIQKVFVMALGIPAIMIIMPLFGIVTALKMTNSRLVLIILYIGINIPFTVFFLIAFFKNLSFTFEEAAAIDGCSPMKTFWIIMLPLAQPGIITVTIFNFITVWNEYFMALIFANNSNMRPLAVGLFSMIQSMRYTGDWAGMFAAVVIVFLPTFILYIILSEKIIANVTGGAIKG